MSLEQLQENVDKSIDIARLLILKGHNPYVPNLAHFLHHGWIRSPVEETYFKMVSSWIKYCDALYYGGQSDGVDRERDIAERLGLKIYYSMEEVPDGS